MIFGQRMMVYCYITQVIHTVVCQCGKGYVGILVGGGHGIDTFKHIVVTGSACG